MVTEQKDTIRSVYGEFSEWDYSTAAAHLRREKYTLPDGSPMWTTTITPHESTQYHLVYDRNFTSKGICTLPGGGLVDFPRTQALWGRVPGVRPETFLDGFSEGSVGICPTNAGWQKGAFWIGNEEVRLLKNDEGELSGTFSVFLQKVGQEEPWLVEELQFKHGQLADGDKRKLEGVGIGFDLPLILKDGNCVAINDLVDHPRIHEDLRNFVDFAVGNRVPLRFWGYLGKVLPRGKSARSIISGTKSGVLRRGVLSPEEIHDFQKIIQEAEIGEYISVTQSESYGPLFIVKRSLPENHTPMVGVGIDDRNKLLIVAVDGRQSESPGTTLNDLAQLLKKKGAVWGGLGSAGGDVVVVAKGLGGKISILNSPSIRDKDTGEGISRPVPALLVLE